MDLGIKIRYNGKWVDLDLFENESVLVSKSVVEVQDFTKRTSEYTKLFRIPGTPTNAGLLGNIFKINLTDSSFNPKLKTSAAITINGNVVIRGNIRLESIYLSDKRHEYEIVLYAQLGDLASNIKDKNMCDLDLSAWNHTNTYDTILSSWVGLIYGGDILYPFIHQGYDTDNVSDLPDIEFGTGSGYFNDSGSPLPSYYFKPAMRVNRLVEEIVKQAGYKVKSDFMDTDYFNKLYMPMTFNDVNGPSSETDLYTNAETSTDNNYAPASDNRIIFDTEIEDNGADYDPTTGLFTLTQPGVHTFVVRYKLNTTGCCNNPQIPTGDINTRVATYLLLNGGRRQENTDYVCDATSFTLSRTYTFNVDGGTYSVVIPLDLVLILQQMTQNV